jgi:hypothetical protein
MEDFRQTLFPVAARLGLIWYKSHAHLVLWDGEGPALAYTAQLLTVDPQKIPGVVLVGEWTPDGLH